MSSGSSNRTWSAHRQAIEGGAARCHRPFGSGSHFSWADHDDPHRYGARMNRPVNERQLEVLRWIADGCPTGKWSEDDNVPKISAAALKSRGLATVTGHGRRWAATITDAGTHYLEHGSYPPSDEPSVAAVRAVRSRRETPPNLDLGEGASALRRIRVSAMGGAAQPVRSVPVNVTPTSSGGQWPGIPAWTDAVCSGEGTPPASLGDEVPGAASQHQGRGEQHAGSPSFDAHGCPIGAAPGSLRPCGGGMTICRSTDERGSRRRVPT